MRFLLLAMAGALWMTGGGRADGMEGAAAAVLARWHSVGTSSLKSSEDATLLRAVLANTNTQALLDAALDKLAARLAPSPHASPAQPAGTASLPRVLLNELLRVESYLEVRGAPPAPPHWVAALRLGPDRAGWWVTNAPALGTALGTPATGKAVNDWVVLGFGDAAPPVVSDLAAQITKSGRPGFGRTDAWMQLDLDLPTLAPMLGWPATIEWPNASLAWAGSGQNLRAEGQLRFARPMIPPPEPWRIPTNTIREPLVGFSALQGIRGWLDHQPWHQGLGVSPTPNQVFSWAQSQIPFQTYLSWQWPDVSNTLHAVEPKLKRLAKEYLPRMNVGEIAHATNMSRISWLGLPLWVPFLAPAADPGFIVAGVMPTESRRAPAPPELYAEITSRTNLVYYDWELSQTRLDDWRNLGTFYGMIAGYQSRPPNTLFTRWMTDTNITSRLGNCVTEVSRISPSELRVLRSGAIGLTGLETASLVSWLDDPAFPGRSEPRPVTRRRAPTPPPAPR